MTSNNYKLEVGSGRTSKAQLGQFMTTQVAYILKGINLPSSHPIVDLPSKSLDIKVMEPFAGNLDLIRHYSVEAECYDIEPKDNKSCQSLIKQRDSLLYPPSFSGKLVVTNPPYLAKNKAKDKTIFEKYGEDDLYKCFLKLLLLDPCEGGVLILPINFLHHLKDFVEVYQILKMNVFEEQVFDDTTSSVCAFNFILRKSTKTERPIEITFYPSLEKLDFIPSKENNWLIGGEVFNLKGDGRYKVKKGDSMLLVKCIDDTQLIGMKLLREEHTGSSSDRAYLSIVTQPALSEDEMAKLVKDFNQTLNGLRQKYKSMFLTSYREGTRKRISFTLVYSLVEFILSQTTS